MRAQVEVCLEEEIVEGTAADEDVPDAGGLSLLALAALGLVPAAAGLSVMEVEIAEMVRRTRECL